MLCALRHEMCKNRAVHAIQKAALAHSISGTLADNFAKRL